MAKLGGRSRRLQDRWSHCGKRSAQQAPRKPILLRASSDQVSGAHRSVAAGGQQVGNLEDRHRCRVHEKEIVAEGEAQST